MRTLNRANHLTFSDTHGFSISISTDLRVAMGIPEEGMRAYFHSTNISPSIMGFLATAGSSHASVTGFQMRGGSQS